MNLMTLTCSDSRDGAVLMLFIYINSLERPGLIICCEWYKLRSYLRSSEWNLLRPESGMFEHFVEIIFFLFPSSITIDWTSKLFFEIRYRWQACRVDFLTDITIISEWCVTCNQRSVYFLRNNRLNFWYKWCYTLRPSMHMHYSCLCSLSVMHQDCLSVQNDIWSINLLCTTETCGFFQPQKNS